ncbi:hypothetical protein K3495_g2090 [Podosphaera aphanis]|nr:hypothetical protein K3495_g2090 [Podosphaera aphanis]
MSRSSAGEERHADAEEDDYMNMIIAEPISTSRDPETYTQRRRRKEREAAMRGRTKSKLERAADEKATREAALATSLLANPTASTNKGLRMMTKMGFTAGAALGPADKTDARLEPLNISVKEDRGGIGLDTERKRRLREEADQQQKRAKVDADEYRERVRKEREVARLEHMVNSAMRVAESLDEQRAKEIYDSAGATPDEPTVDSELRRRKFSTTPSKQVNILWRGLVRKREEKERERRMRFDLQQSLSRLPTYEDSDEDKRALGKETLQYTLVENVEEEDPELEEFNSLEPAERLKMLVAHLRKYNYCFWCKHTYPNQEMDGCPGLTEEDHD